MRLEYYSSEKLAKEIIEITGKYLDLASFRVLFFGSRVSESGNERSDIDIGIDGPTPVPPAVLSEIKEEVENLPTLYKIEIVDFRQVSEDFRTVAFQHAEEINILLPGDN